VRDFIRKNRRYPDECKATRANGKVVIGMTIAPDGTPHDIHVAVSSGNSHMDNEAMRVAMMMPKWEAAKDIQNGQERQYRMSMTFRPGR
jgi:TonB family protein